MKVSPATTQRVAVGFMWTLAAITFAVLIFISRSSSRTACPTSRGAF